MAFGFLSSLSCHGFDNLLVLAARNATLFARCTLSLDWAGLARIRPITVKFLAVLSPCVAIQIPDRRRTDIQSKIPTVNGSKGQSTDQTEKKNSHRIRRTVNGRHKISNAIVQQ